MDEKSNGRRDWLDSFLPGTRRYIDDDGFSGRVMDKLPRSRKTKGARAERACLWVLLSCASVGCFVASFFWPGAALLFSSVERLFGTFPFSFQSLPLVSVILVAAVVWGGISLARDVL